jgi:hypothetical protein
VSVQLVGAQQIFTVRARDGAPERGRILYLLGGGAEPARGHDPRPPSQADEVWTVGGQPRYCGDGVSESMAKRHLSGPVRDPAIGRIP